MKDTNTVELPQWRSVAEDPPGDEKVLILMSSGALAFAWPHRSLRGPWRRAFVKVQQGGRDTLTPEEMFLLQEADLDNPEHTEIIRWDIPLGDWRTQRVSPDEVTHWMEPL